MTTPLRYALYRRVSKPSQAEKELSLPEQADEQREHVAARGGIVVHEFEDRGISGKYTEKRPQFLLMNEAAARNEFDVILIHRSDRAFRNREEAVIFKAGWARRGVRAESVTEPWYGGTDVSDQIAEAMFEIFNEDYLRKLSTEVHKSLKQMAVKQGRQNGRPAFGYGWNDTKKGWVVNQAEAPWVKHIFQRCVEGRGFDWIARELNTLGIAPPSTRSDIHGRASVVRWKRNGWYGSSIKSILQNRRLTGNILYNDVWLPGAHEPIIDTATFEIVQSLVNRRSAGRAEASDGLFVGNIALCPACWERGVQQPMHRIRSSVIPTDRAERYQGYMCGAVRKWRVRRYLGHIAEERPCPGFQLGEKALVDATIHALDAIIGDSDLADLAEQAAELKPMLSTADDYQARFADLRRELAGIPEERNGYLRLAARSRITDEQLDVFMEEVEKKEAALSASIAEIELRLAQPPEPTPAMAYALRRAIQEAGMPQQSRDALKLWLYYVVPWKDRSGVTLFWRH